MPRKGKQSSPGQNVEALRLVLEDNEKKQVKQLREVVRLKDIKTNLELVLESFTHSSLCCGQGSSQSLTHASGPSQGNVMQTRAKTRKARNTLNEQIEPINQNFQPSSSGNVDPPETVKTEASSFLDVEQEVLKNSGQTSQTLGPDLWCTSPPHRPFSQSMGYDIISPPTDSGYPTEAPFSLNSGRSMSHASESSEQAFPQYQPYPTNVNTLMPTSDRDSLRSLSHAVKADVTTSQMSAPLSKDSFKLIFSLNESYQMRRNEVLFSPANETIDGNPQAFSPTVHRGGIVMSSVNDQNVEGTSGRGDTPDNLSDLGERRANTSRGDAPFSENHQFVSYLSDHDSATNKSVAKKETDRAISRIPGSYTSPAGKSAKDTDTFSLSEDSQNLSDVSLGGYQSLLPLGPTQSSPSPFNTSNLYEENSKPLDLPLEAPNISQTSTFSATTTSVVSMSPLNSISDLLKDETLLHTYPPISSTQMSSFQSPLPSVQSSQPHHDVTTVTTSGTVGDLSMTPSALSCTLGGIGSLSTPRLQTVPPIRGTFHQHAAKSYRQDDQLKVVGQHGSRQLHKSGNKPCRNEDLLKPKQSANRQSYRYQPYQTLRQNQETRSVGEQQELPAHHTNKAMNYQQRGLIQQTSQSPSLYQQRPFQAYEYQKTHLPQPGSFDNSLAPKQKSQSMKFNKKLPQQIELQSSNSNVPQPTPQNEQQVQGKSSKPWFQTSQHQNQEPQDVTSLSHPTSPFSRQSYMAAPISQHQNSSRQAAVTTTGIVQEGQTIGAQQVQGKSIKPWFQTAESMNQNSQTITSLSYLTPHSSNHSYISALSSDPQHQSPSKQGAVVTTVEAGQPTWAQQVQGKSSKSWFQASEHQNKDPQTVTSLSYLTFQMSNQTYIANLSSSSQPQSSSRQAAAITTVPIQEGQSTGVSQNSWANIGGSQLMSSANLTRGLHCDDVGTGENLYQIKEWLLSNAREERCPGSTDGLRSQLVDEVLGTLDPTGWISQILQSSPTINKRADGEETSNPRPGTPFPKDRNLPGDGAVGYCQEIVNSQMSSLPFDDPQMRSVFTGKPEKSVSVLSFPSVEGEKVKDKALATTAQKRRGSKKDTKKALKKKLKKDRSRQDQDKIKAILYDSAQDDEGGKKKELIDHLCNDCPTSENLLSSELSSMEEFFDD